MAAECWGALRSFPHTSIHQEPEGCGWAQGAGGNPGGFEVVLTECPPPAEMSSWLCSGTALLQHGSPEAGGGFVTGGMQGPGSVPAVTQLCGDLVGPCFTPWVRVTRCHRQLGCSSMVSHGMSRWPQWGQMPPPMGAIPLQGTWQGTVGITTVLQEPPL